MPNVAAGTVWGAWHAPHTRQRKRFDDANGDNKGTATLCS